MDETLEPPLSGQLPPSDDEELRLAPVECASREQQRRDFLRRWAESATPLPQPKHSLTWRFRLADVFWLTFAVALGGIGGAAVPGKLRATVIGLLITALIVLPIYVSLDDKVWQRIWATLMVAYVVSVAIVFATSA